jgi:Leucine-rich repeat (LRR) protein
MESILGLFVLAVSVGSSYAAYDVGSDVAELSRMVTEEDNIPESELQVLQEFYNATHGNYWKWGQAPGVPWNFTGDANPCLDQWEGVECTKEFSDGYLHVKALLLSNYDLFGFLTDQIGYLQHLTNLTLSYNMLSYGDFPSSLTMLSMLQHLDITGSYMEGTIPNNIGNMSALQYLSLGDTLMIGTLPPSVCDLVKLQHFGVGNNAFSGTLPNCIGQLTRLQYFGIDNNGLTGTLPITVGSFVDATSFLVSENYFNGTLPATLAALTQARTLDANINMFSGSIPEFLGSLPYLVGTNLRRNRFTGSIPSSLGTAAQLQYVYLDENLLTGSIPATFCQLGLATEIQCSMNMLTGTIPPCLGSLPSLKSLALEYNYLSGPLITFQQSSRLKLLNFRYNYLTGTVPDISLQPLEFSASANLLTGSLPASLFASPALEVVDLSQNQLTGFFPDVPPLALEGSNMALISCADNYLSGSLPQSFGQYAELTYLNLSNNVLTGSIPAAIANLTLLNFIYLGSNYLTGSIPSGPFNFSRLSYIFLDFNMLTGRLPNSLGDIATAQNLNLCSNYLSGPLPETLAQLSALKVLLLMDNQLSGTLDGVFDPSQAHLVTVQLSDNQLTGTLPDSLAQLPSLQVFAAVSNCFEGSIPESLCSSGSLNTLALDGLQSATSCQYKLFPAALEGSVVATSLYSIRNPLSGGVPSCLFGMGNLTTLHLSGNGLTGTIPEEVVVSPTLTDLSLSHNQLHHHIPATILARDWANLDLSYNRFGGRLLTAVGSNYSTRTAIKLDNNRLSGPFPRALRPLQNVSVLESNIFSCEASRDDLPPHDPNLGKYECGSVTFDATMYAWLAVCVALGAAAALAWTSKARFAHAARRIQLWWEATCQAHHCTVNTAHLRAVEAVVSVIAKTSCLCGLFVLLFLTPAYVACSEAYATYAYEYAYGLSAAFLSGPVPFALMFVGFALVTVLLALGSSVFAYQHSVPPAPDGTTAEDSILWTFAVRAVVVVLNFMVVLGVNTAYVIIALNQNGIALTLAQIALALFKVAFNSACSPVLMRWACQRFLGRQPSAPSYVTLQLFVSVVNNILVPCLVVAVISPSCFYNVFKAAAEVRSQFTYGGRCTEFVLISLTNVECLAVDLVTAHTSYRPPFEYTYECSSSFITYYSPAFVIMCMVAGFGIPLAQVVLQRLHERAVVGSRWHAVLDLVLPRILKPVYVTVGGEGGAVQLVVRNLYVPFFDASQHVITLLTYLALLLTFGTVFPPLAVCFAVTVVCMAAFTRLKVGRFLTDVSDHREEAAKSLGEVECRRDTVENAHTRPAPGLGLGYVAVLEQECEGVGSEKVLGRSVAMVVAFSCVFYTLFLFDTLGDAVGLSGAYWVLTVVPCLPVVGFVGYKLVLRATGGSARLAAPTTTAAAIELQSVASPLAPDAV